MQALRLEFITFCKKVDKNFYYRLPEPDFAIHYTIAHKNTSLLETLFTSIIQIHVLLF